MTLPLEGIKIVDLSRMSPGPYCTMLLGDMGADVLKVEEPAPPTEGRRVARFPAPTRTPEEEERSRAHSATGRNKRSIALNLRTEEAKEIFYKLCETADVVLEGFRPGVVKRLGIDYDTLSKINPRIVYCSLSGFGQTGPYNQLPGHDINYIALGGALALIGERGGKPAIPLNLMADMAGGGAIAAFGILCALMARARTGRGQYVDIAMSDGVTQLLVEVLSSYLATGKAVTRGIHQLGGIRVHYNAYECKDGKWISIGSLEPWFYENFCKSIGREDFLPYEYADDGKHREMIAIARDIFKTKTRDEWEELMHQTDQCTAPILELDELVEHPHVKARNLVIEVEHPKYGKIKHAGFGVKLSDTQPSVRSFAPHVGEHTDSVLESLGYSKERIKELKEAGAIR